MKRWKNESLSGWEISSIIVHMTYKMPTVSECRLLDDCISEDI